MECLRYDGYYENLKDAKLDCSTRNRCTWIVNMYCNDNQFHVCSNNSRLYPGTSSTSCVYEKIKSNGKC